ncbi:MAG: phosphoribosylanthranilate isomerase [Proteobacteria bacterium]|nr:phosphoribosylanthranilate isomerase [Pseudomonadota bacterium]
MIRVKICGITRLDDAKLAESLGAHALGFIFYKESKRYISPEDARKIIINLTPLIIKVGVFVNEDLDTIRSIKEFCSLDRIQIFYDDQEKYKFLDPSIYIPVFKVKDERDILEAMKFEHLTLFDTYHQGLHGGTGKTFDWGLLKKANKPFILAGGINNDNILEALKYRPFAVDVASGLESSKGIKDHKKMFEFFKKIRENQKDFL